MKRAFVLYILPILLIVIAIFCLNHSWAVVPYPPNETVSAEAQPAKQPVEDVAEKLRKHEVQSAQFFNDVRKELRQAKEENTLIAREIFSWKLISVILFLFNFMLFVLLWRSLRLKNSK